MNFFDKLNAAIARNQSLLFVGLDPNPEMMPARYCSVEDTESIIPGWDWLQYQIAQTANLVCAYNLGFLRSLGARDWNAATDAQGYPCPHPDYLRCQTQ